MIFGLDKKPPYKYGGFLLYLYVQNRVSPCPLRVRPLSKIGMIETGRGSRERRGNPHRKQFLKTAKQHTSEKSSFQSGEAIKGTKSCSQIRPAKSISSLGASENGSGRSKIPQANVEGQTNASGRRHGRR